MVRRYGKAIFVVLISALFNLWRGYLLISVQAHPSFGVAALGSNDPFLVSNILGGLGILAAAFLCDRINSADMRRRMAAGLAFAAGVLTLCLNFALTYPAYMVFLNLASIAGYGIVGVYCFDLLRKIPYGERPLIISAPLVVYALLRMPTDLYEQFVSSNISAPFIWISAGYAAIWGLMFLVLPTLKKLFLDPPAGGQERRQGTAKLLILALFCAMTVYALFGVYDAFSLGSPIEESYGIVIRAVQIFSPLLACYICTRFGRYASIIGSICLTGIGMLCHFFSYSGLLALFFALFSAFGLHMFAIPFRTLFIDLSFSSKRPALVAALGSVAFALFMPIGTAISALMGTVQRETGVVIYLLFFLLSLPLVMFFFQKVQGAYRRSVEESSERSVPRLERQSINEFGFTKREAEMFLLFAKGQAPSEIAENLFLSESTVKTHLHNIVKKTGVKNRAELVERYKGFAE